MGSVSEDRQPNFSPGLAIKQPCRLATTGNVAFFAGAPNGLGVVDGVQTVSGDRVLFKDQADPTQNGIWEASTGVWTRSPDFDGIRDVAQGTIVLIILGTANASKLYQVTTANPVTPGSSAITFQQLPVSGTNVPQVLDSIAALKALAAPSSSVTYMVRGFAAAGDGGGGFYWWNAADNTADNGGTVIQLNAGGVGRFNKLF